MNAPILIAETPNAGSLGHRFLVSRGGIGDTLASAFVGRGRKADEAAGANFLAVRQKVKQAFSGRDSHLVLVLAGVDARRLTAERKARVLGLLRGLLPHVDLAADAVEWGLEKRMVVPAPSLAELLAGDLAGLPCADHSQGPLDARTAKGGRWLAAAAALVLVAAVAAAFASGAFAPVAAERGDAPETPEQPKGPPAKEKGTEPPKPTPAQLEVKGLKERAEKSGDPDDLAKVESEAAQLRKKPEHREHKDELAAIRKTAANRREAFLLARNKENDKWDEVIQTVFREGHKADPERIVAMKEELSKVPPEFKGKTEAAKILEDRQSGLKWEVVKKAVEGGQKSGDYLEAARSLGKQNKEFGKKWDQLRDGLVQAVQSDLVSGTDRFLAQEQYKEARERIRKLGRTELLALSIDGKLKDEAASALDRVDDKEDRARYERIVDSSPEMLDNRIRGYLNSEVRTKKHRQAAAELLRWERMERKAVKVKTELDRNKGDAVGKKVEFELQVSGRSEPEVRKISVNKKGDALLVANNFAMDFGMAPQDVLTIRIVNAAKSRSEIKAELSSTLRDFAKKPEFALESFYFTVTGAAPPPLPKYDDPPRKVEPARSDDTPSIKGIQP